MEQLHSSSRSHLWRALRGAYYAYGSLQARESDGTLKAEGKGTHGVDFSRDRIGGRIDSRDVRPGGSPARGRIWYQYSSPGLSNWYKQSGSENLKSTWLSQNKYGNLNTSYSIAQTYGQVCEVDPGVLPDECANSASRNHKW